MSFLNLDNNVYELLENLGQSKSPGENIKKEYFSSKNILIKIVQL